MEIVCSAVLTYVTIIALIRLSGKRSTSQMNNFDWVVTVSLGSISASMILLKDVTWSEGALAIFCLLGMQYLLTWAVRRFPAIANLVKPEPALLYEDGRWNEIRMDKERITRSEVLAAVGHQGIEDVSGVKRVVLETDATLSVIPA